jgi:hypothetical protein
MGCLRWRVVVAALGLFGGWFLDVAGTGLRMYILFERWFMGGEGYSCDLKGQVIDLRKIWSKWVLFLMVLVVGVSVAGCAWGNYTHIYLTGISPNTGDNIAGLVLKNADDGVPAKSSASFDLQWSPFDYPATQITNNELTFYYSDGASADIEPDEGVARKAKFTMLYGLRNQNPGTAGNTAGVTGAISADFSPHPTSLPASAVQFTYAVCDIATTFSNAVSIDLPGANSSPYTLGARDHQYPSVISNDTQLSIVKIKTEANISDRTGGSDNDGLMYVGSWYNKLPVYPAVTPPAMNLTSVDVPVNVTTTGYAWDLDTVKVEAVGGKDNGITPVPYVPSSGTKVSDTVHIRLTGQPTSVAKTDFIVSGTVVKSNKSVVLKGVSKLISVTPVQGPYVVSSPTNTLSFSSDNADEVIEIKTDSLNLEGTMNNHNLYLSNGQPLFATGDTEEDFLLGSMRVTVERNVGGNPVKVIYHFKATGTQTTSGNLEVYPGGKTASGDYLLDPVLLTSGTYVPPGTPTFAFTPNPLPLTPRLTPALTAAEGKITSTPSGVTIEAIATTAAAAKTAATGTFTLSKLENTKLTVVASSTGTLQVSGTPEKVGSDTIYVRGKVGTTSVPDPVPFTITVGAATLTPSSTPSGTVGATWTDSPITISSAAGAVTGLSFSSTSSLLSTTWNGLTLTISGNSVTISGTPSVSGTPSIPIYGKAGGFDAQGSIKLNIAAASTTPPVTTAPSLNAIAGVQITVDGSTPLTQTIPITSTPAGTVSITHLTGPSGSTSLGNLSCQWKGLTVSVTGTNITITGKPDDVTASIDGEFSIVGTVTIGAAVTPVTQDFTITLAPKGTPTISPISALTVTVGEEVEKTITVQSSSGTVSLTGVTPTSWNGLTLTTSGSLVSVAGTPQDEESEKFTVTGIVDGKTVTGEFTINVVAKTVAPPAGDSDELGVPSSWQKERSGTSYTLSIPITKEFIDRFDADGDGKLTSDELASITPRVTGPYATVDSVDDWSVKGNILSVELGFTPKEGHEKDWYKDLFLEDLTFTGTNGKSARYDFEDGVELEKVSNGSVRKGGGGGCEVGASLLALALLAPVVRKKRLTK